LKLKFLAFNIIIAAVIATSILFLSQKGFLRHTELSSLDFSFRMRGSLPSNPHIVIVEIRDPDITGIGKWPWKRSWHAAIARALNYLGAKYICFDIIFSEPSTEEDDGLFEGALKITKNVYLPFAFQDTPYDLDNALMPLERFYSHAQGIGAVNIETDIDGSVRRSALLFQTKEGAYPSLALKVAADYLGMKTQEIKPRYVLLSNSESKVKIPLENKRMLINWLGKWGETFKHYGVVDVLAAYKDQLERKESGIDVADFKDSICLIAVTATGLCDTKSSPIQPEYPGVGVIATAISNILDKNFIYTPPLWVNILILYLLALLPSFLIFGEKPLKETAFVFLVGGVYFGAEFLLFKKGVYIDLFRPLLGLFASYLSVETYNFVRIAVERQAFFKMSVTDGLTGLYNIRYFKMLVETEIKLAKSGSVKNFAIVMSDVDHFKHFNDTYGHQVGDLVLKEVANVLKNSVRSTHIVARYGGEEMIVLLKDTSVKEAVAIAEKIRKNVETHTVKDQNNTYKVAISLGVATFKNGDDVDAMVKRADDGLYKSKEGGRNCVSCVEEDS